MTDRNHIQSSIHVLKSKLPKVGSLVERLARRLDPSMLDYLSTNPEVVEIVIILAERVVG